MTSSSSPALIVPLPCGEEDSCPGYYAPPTSMSSSSAFGPSSSSSSSTPLSSSSSSTGHDRAGQGGVCLYPMAPRGQVVVAISTGSGHVIAWEGAADQFEGRVMVPCSLRLRHWLQRIVTALSPLRQVDGITRRLMTIPGSMYRFLMNLAQVSASLGFVNTLPIYGLDGQHACVQFIRLWLLSRGPPSVPPNSPSALARERYHDWNALHVRQRRLTRTLLGAGSSLLLVNAVFGSLALVL
mmetsp:Transcript_8250/g.10420  ORF Transcript_8250/g.10420 Transcript_8250/m.10420 type:complete len:240 (+) Transcript_8250:94-813(+)